MRLDDDLEAEVVAWAKHHGLSKSSAIRILLRMALEERASHENR